MQIYNSLTRRKETFIPIKKNIVSIYSCGPTVYDEPHIGHVRAAFVFDIVVRYLEYDGYKVRYVRNITDVDDKIIDRARKDCKEPDLKAAVKKISTVYTRAYHDAMRKMGLKKPASEPRATEYIPKMVKLIKRMIKNKFAYEATGDVYFDVRAYHQSTGDYGKLSNRDIDSLQSGARIEPGDKKRDPLDFALWKKSKPGEPSWKSPWSLGRPGWHIECSTMSEDLLGGNFDIHGGGLDLIFPHHENELAQARACGFKFSNIWMHNGLLTINGQKMAKSLGNFITVSDFFARHKDPDLLRLLFLGSHYRYPVDYTEEKIKGIASARETIEIFLQNANLALQKSDKTKELLRSRYYRNQCKYKHFRNIFVSVMEDDFNTPLALGDIFKCVDDGNKILQKENLTEREYDDLSGSRGFIEEVTSEVFGLNLSKEVSERKISIFLSENMKVRDLAGLSAEEREMVDERNKARREKDFEKADRIRNELSKKGVVMEDTKEGLVCRRR